MANIENVNNLSQVLDQVSGQNVENRLTRLASIGGQRIEGNSEQSLRYSVSRLALSNEDAEARKFLEEKMSEAGMLVSQETFATIGYYEGTNPDLKPILIISHHDSVPKGGMYDGTVGVNAGIEIVDILSRNQIRLPHPIVVVSFTEEESARFNTGLGGSRASTQGLTDAELDQTDQKGISKRTALENLGFNPERSKIPLSLFDNALASLELHVEQNTRLADSGTELGIVTAIAAPTRYKINIERPINQSSRESKDKDNSVYLNIDVAGRPGHSGATPMTPGVRADALVTQSEILIHLNALQNKYANTQIHVGNLELNEGASINKIPGSSHLSLRLEGDDSKKIIQDIQAYIERRNQQLVKESYSTENPITLEKFFDQPNSYQNETNLRSFSAAAYFIKAVQATASIHREQDTVGTVGTFSISENGRITLGIDLRGINKTDRDTAALKIDEIREKLLQSSKVTGGLNISSIKEEIAGSSGNPTLMDDLLVNISQEVLEQNNICSFVLTFSPAGHDSQNVSRTGIPTVMFFIPSRNKGIAHHQDEFSTQKDLENGTKALMAMVYKLASLSNNDLSQATA